jgi:hypothetical protein
MELDMSEVHDAVARLADRLDLVDQAIRERDTSHVDALSAQVERADQMLAFLRDESAPEQSAELATDHPTAETEFAAPTDHDPGLLS